MNKEYDELKEIGGTVIKISAENSGSLNPIQQESVLEKEATEKYKVDGYHHGAAMGQKNVKVCRDLQQLGNVKSVNITVCRDFQRFSIPALGIFFISGDISLRGGMIWAERDKKDFTVSFCCILNGRK